MAGKGCLRRWYLTGKVLISYQDAGYGSFDTLLIQTQSLIFYKFWSRPIIWIRIQAKWYGPEQRGNWYRFGSLSLKIKNNTYFVFKTSTFLRLFRANWFPQLIYCKQIALLHHLFALDRHLYNFLRIRIQDIRYVYEGSGSRKIVQIWRNRVRNSWLG